MKAIITKYLPFTNHKPSRIKASAEGVKSKIYTCNSLETDGRKTLHCQVAELFAASNNWPTNLASGGLPSGEWAHCFIPSKLFAKIDPEKVQYGSPNHEQACRDLVSSTKL